MVERIKIQVEDKNKTKSRAGRFVLIGILVLYLIAILTTIIIVNAHKTTEKVGLTGSGNYEGSYYAVEVAFYDLEVGGGQTKIYAKDFVLETFSKDIKATCFEGGATTYTLKRNKSVEYVKVMFPRTESYYQFYMADVEYKGEEVEIMNVQSVGEILVPIVAVETFLFFIIFMMAFVIIKNANYSKAFSQKCKEINQEVVRELKARGFVSRKVFYMPSPRTGETNMEKMILAVDNKHEKFAFVDYINKECVIANIDDIVNYKVIENNGVNVKQYSSTTIFNMPYTETETYDVCKKLQLVITLNDSDKTNVVYEFVRSGVRTSSSIYKEMSRVIIDVTSLLDVETGAVSKDGKAVVKCKYCGVKNKADASHCCSCGAVLE